MLARCRWGGQRVSALIGSVRLSVQINEQINEQWCGPTLPTCDPALPTCGTQYTSKERPGRLYWSGLLAAGIVVAASTDTEIEESPVEKDPPTAVLKYLDELYDTQQYFELFKSLERYENVKNAEVLWRRARAEWERIKLEGKISAARIQNAHELIDQALEADSNNSSAHRWKAILSNAHCGALGMKQQFQNLDTMRYHLQRAVELNPADATALTLLGSWHIELLELSWYERKFAATFLGDFPACSYEEALELLLRAEDIAPKSWNRNIFLIGKMYFRLGDKLQARQFVELALDQPVVTDDDEIIAKEAETFYKKNFVLL